MTPPALSVALSTYDQPNALVYSLLGYQRQTYRDFEVIVADDGSDDETKSIVEEFRKTSDFPIKHVWQENVGYRRSLIVNKAVKISEGRTIVLSDGDCIPHRDFLKAHAEAAGSGRFATGGYVFLNEEMSRTLTRQNVKAGEFEKFMTGGYRWRFRLIHWQSSIGILLGSIKRPKVYGCNISVDREVYAAVNGYDNNFIRIGKEDSDLRNRLRRHGAKPVSLWGKAWVYHIHSVMDPKRTRGRIPRDSRPAYYYRPDIPIRAENGLEQSE